MQEAGSLRPSDRSTGPHPRPQNSPKSEASPDARAAARKERLSAPRLHEEAIGSSFRPPEHPDLSRISRFFASLTVRQVDPPYGLQPTTRIKEQTRACDLPPPTSSRACRFESQPRPAALLALIIRPCGSEGSAHKTIIYKDLTYKSPPPEESRSPKQARISRPGKAPSDSMASSQPVARRLRQSGRPRPLGAMATPA
jgi:hypothetical protein